MSNLSNLDRLILAQAVYELGANSWSAVAKLLTKHPLLQQPKSFFTPQSCQAIYIHLMKEAGLDPEATHAAHATVNLQLAQRHYQARMLELRELIAKEEESFKRIISEIEDVRSGRWDDKLKAKIKGVPPESAPRIGKSESEGPVDEISTSSLTDPASPQPQAKDIEDASKGTQPISEVASDIDPQEMPSEPLAISYESRDSPGRNSPHDDERSGSRDLSTPHSRGQSVRTASPALSQGKMAAVDESSESDVPPPPHHHNPRRAASTTNFPFARVRVHSRNADHPIISTQPEKAASQWPHSVLSEDQEPSKSDAKPLSTTFIDDSYSQMEKPADEVKRKVSVTEGMDSPRDRKRIREQSEPADDDDTGTKRRDVAFKRFQSVVNLIHSQISQHRNGNIFHNPIKRSDAPDYHDIVKRPMDLKTIKARVRDGVISNAIEFQRDVFLMFANAMMYNRPGSDIHQMAEEMMLESESHINTLRTAEMTHRI